MKRRSLNGAQRVAVVTALGFAIYLFGQWLLATLEGSPLDTGWVAYAPLNSATFTRVRILHPWVALLIWLVLIAVWLGVALVILRPGGGERPSPD
jgi:Zn-dependent protease